MKLFITIFLAIVLANLTSTAVVTVFSLYTTKLALEEANNKIIIEQQNAKKQSTLEAIDRSAKLVAMQERSRQDARINQRNQEVCQFWKDQYKKTREPYDKEMMITGCKQAGMNYDKDG